MRISDWSSDVCSSDLRRLALCCDWLLLRLATDCGAPLRLPPIPCPASAVARKAAAIHTLSDAPAQDSEAPLGGRGRLQGQRRGRPATTGLRGGKPSDRPQLDERKA